MSADLKYIKIIILIQYQNLLLGVSCDNDYQVDKI